MKAEAAASSGNIAMSPPDAKSQDRRPGNRDLKDESLNGMTSEIKFIRTEVGVLCQWWQLT